MRKTFASIAAVSLLLSSSMAVAGSTAAGASRLSVAKAARASAKPGKSQLEGNGLLFAALGAAAVIAAIIVIADDGDDAPSSR